MRRMGAAWFLACLAATRVDARGEVGPSLVSRKDASLVLRQGRSEGPARRDQLQSSAVDTNSELRLRGGGATLSRLLPILLGKKQCRILMLGLDAAGKTTILYQLKLGEMTNTAPTLGFNVETVAYKNIEFMVWDMGGQDAIRQLWQHYYKNAQALIFVVDSSDQERLTEARDELQKLMAEEELRDSVLLVFANKQDMPDARSVQEIAEELGLQELQNRVWYIQACSASTGDGLTDGLDWLVSKMAAKL